MFIKTFEISELNHQGMVPTRCLFKLIISPDREIIWLRTDYGSSTNWQNNIVIDFRNYTGQILIVLCRLINYYCKIIKLLDWFKDKYLHIENINKILPYTNIFKDYEYQNAYTFYIRHLVILLSLISHLVYWTE